MRLTKVYLYIMRKASQPDWVTSHPTARAANGDKDLTSFLECSRPLLPIMIIESHGRLSVVRLRVHSSARLPESTFSNSSNDLAALPVKGFVISSRNQLQPGYTTSKLPLICFCPASLVNSGVTVIRKSWLESPSCADKESRCRWSAFNARFQ